MKICGKYSIEKELSEYHIAHPRGTICPECRKCNMALSLFKDNTEFLERVVYYLKGDSY